MPWSRKSLIYRVASNLVYDFIMGHRIGLASIFSNTVLSYGAVLGLGGNYNQPITVSRELYRSVIWFIGVWVLRLAFAITIGPSIACIDGVLDHFNRVYSRASAVAFLDWIIYVLAQRSRPKLRHKLLVYIIQVCLLYFTISTIGPRYNPWLVNKATILSTCPSGPALNDPLLLQKATMCPLLPGGSLIPSELPSLVAAASNDLAHQCNLLIGRGEEQATCEASKDIVNAGTNGRDDKECYEQGKSIKLLKACQEKHNSPILEALVNLSVSLEEVKMVEKCRQSNRKLQWLETVLLSTRKFADGLYGYMGLK
jgi:hypothetical protein